MPRKYDYDTIIIGAGISGLVCGCYLAKAGMKTLIVEKNAKPGGYCTSFRRGGFHFDACVHSFGSLREGGIIRNIIRELNIEDRLRINRYDPSDIIFAPHYRIHFWNDLNKVLQEFQNNFPAEAEKIQEFFSFIKGCEGLSFNPLRGITFGELLDRYFGDKRLKAILSLPILGNAGMSAGKISALVGTLLYKEFMLDGGYYPDKSIQTFADVLLQRYREFGGQVFLSCEAKGLKIAEHGVGGVELKNKGLLTSKYVVSNADASQTFLALTGKPYLNNDMLNKLSTLEPSLSMFILYLGVVGDFNRITSIPQNANIWFMPGYDIDSMYSKAMKGDIDNLDWFLIRLSSHHNSILMLVNSPFKDEEYWKAHKQRLIDMFIRKIERVIPDLSSYITFKDAATPDTLFRWTNNYRGAAYGWAGTPSQLGVTGFTQRTHINNLYLTGHWATLAQGVSGVAYLGRDTSNKILNKENRL